MNTYQTGTWIKRDGYRSFESSLINRPWRIDEQEFWRFLKSIHPVTHHS
ncbi:MAG: hypothetical protein WCP35_04470 [Verrucomicrobiota bacterium]